MTSNPLVQLVDGVIAREENILISGANLSVNPGDFVLLSGPNGAGKSTFLTALAGEKFLTSGTLLFESTPRPEISLKELAQKRSLMLQQDDAVDHLRAKDVLELAAIGSALPNYAQEFVAKVIEVEFREKKLEALSIGQRTRVFLAATVIQNSKLMLLDEPTAGLDVNSISLLSDYLLAHTANGGAVIVATHEDSLRPSAKSELVISEERLTVKTLG
jgi:iron complex transport system ATP-binding protein